MWLLDLIDALKKDFVLKHGILFHLHTNMLCNYYQLD